MIKSAFKNYFKFFLNIFSVMGVFYFAVILAFSIFAGGTISIVGNGLTESNEQLMEFLRVKLGNVSAPQFLQPDFLKSLLNGLIDILSQNISHAALKLGLLIFSALLLIVLGVKFSGYLCKYVIRRDVRGEEAKRGIAAFFIRTLISLVFTAVLVVLSYYWLFSAAILAFVKVFLNTFEQLTTCKNVYFPIYDAKQIMTSKNTLRLMLANYCTFLLTLAVGLALYFLIHPLIALIVFFPLYVYGDTIIEFTAVDYFTKMKENGKLLPLPKKEKADKNA